MKKTIKLRFTLALLVAMLMAAANVQAAEYNLRICGVKVTDDNKSDLTVINGTNGCTITGIVNYNSTTNTLRLENATISHSNTCIYSIIEGMKIELVGNNTVTSNNINMSTIYLGSSTYKITNNTIYGSGTLNVPSSNTAINITRSALTIKGCTVNANGKGGICGLDNSSLIIDGAAVTAAGSLQGSIAEFYAGITLNGCFISSPDGAQIINGNVCDADGNILKDEIKIEPTKYELKICGIQVTGANKDDLSVIPNVTGTVYYNPDTKTLTLNNVEMTTTGKTCCILSNIDGLIIDVSGSNTLTGNGWSPISFEGSNSGIIQGSGTLNITNHAADKEGIFIRNGSLNIINCTLNATAGNYGIKGGGNKPLSIDNAVVSATGTNGGSIVGFNALNLLNDCTISEPAKAVFNITQKAVCNAAGTIIKETVKIIPAYNIWICGTQVTSLNKDDLSIIEGVEGTVTYNPDTKTLRLDNAVITGSSSIGTINSEIDGLNIEVVGNNTVSNSNSYSFSTISIDKKCTILGSGTLNIINTQSTGKAIYSYKALLTIRNCTVNITSNHEGISGFYGKVEDVLSIENAAVTINETQAGAIRSYNEVKLINCVIAEPAGAVFNQTEKALCYTDGTIVKAKVRIVPGTAYNLKICGVQVTSLNKDDLSTISGVTGTANYNSDTNTLRLENAAITAASDVSAICSEIEGVTIELIGDNTVTINGVSAIKFYEKSGTILGGGTLTVTNQANDFAIYAQNTSLTIKNCTLNATGGRRGITGSGNTGTLTIENANVRAKGTSEGSISRFAAINLNGCAVTEPVGGRVSKGGDDYNAVRDVAGIIIKETVKIKPATVYQLWICGVPVTSLNKNDLSTIPGVTTGTVNFNSTTKTLRLENAAITAASDVSAIRSEIEGVNIEIIGDNTVTINGVSAIKFYEKSGTILGGGTLTVTNQANDFAIYAQNTSLTIKNCTVNATGGRRGITGSGNSGTLTIDNANVTAMGTNEGSISRFADIILNGCAVTEPAGGRVSKGGDTFNAVRDAEGNIIKGTVKIAPAAVYQVWICGVPVTSLNKNDLSIIPGVTGTANYNPDTKTLKLKSTSITPIGDNHGIYSEIDGLIIEVIGNNTINATYSIGILSNMPFTIQGGDTLNVNSPNSAAIWANRTSLTIKNCTLNAAGSNYGIFGDDTGLATLIIENAEVSASSQGSGGDYGSIAGFKEINLTDCAIIEPDGALFNPEKKAVCYADGTIVDRATVKIVPTIHKLWICGVQVTDLNKNNLADIPGVSTGMVNYNSDTKTLRLENATISTTGKVNAIRSGIEGLKIELVGINTVTSNGWSAIQFDQKSGTILDSGTLNVSNSAEDYAIYVKNTSLTIKNCTVNAEAGRRGITGGDNPSTLNIENATVTAKGAGEGSITRFANINLTGCAVSEPAGGQISKGADNYYAVRDAAGSVIKETVKLMPAAVYKLWICGVPVTSLNKDDLSTIPGVSSGMIKYNSDTNTLRLENAAITATSDDIAGICIHSEIEGLKIEVIGSNNLSSNYATIHIEGKSTVIEGGGTLNLNSSDIGIHVYLAPSLTIRNCTVNVIGEAGIVGICEIENVLKIENATVSATGTTDGSIFNFGAINLINCALTHPAGAKIINGSIYDTDGNIITTEVKIVPAITYNLWICDVQVTSINKDDLSVIHEVTSGTVNYNPDTKTLRLENAVITATVDDYSGTCIYSEIEGLIIEVIGNNNLTGNYQTIVFEKKSAVIEGSGTLNVNSNSVGIYANETPSLTIRNCTVNVIGEAGIIGSAGENENVLNIENAVVTAVGTIHGSIRDFYEINLIDCRISEPQGAKITNGKVTDAEGNVIKGTVKIVRKDIGTDIDKIDTYTVTLYPNPVRDIFHIQSEKPVTALRIYNVNGSLVTQAAGENISEINLARLPTGIYMVRVEAGERESVIRIVKE